MLVALVQLLITRGQLKTAIAQNTTSITQMAGDHERSRRELAISMMGAWTRSLDQKGSISRKLVETLDESQARSLANQEDVELNGTEQKKLYAAAFEMTSGEEKVLMPSRESAELRWRMITYLNSLETVLVAWNYGIADKGIIEEQFAYLVSDQKGHAVLANFRKAEGGKDTYPAIDAFVRHRQAVQLSAAKGKPPIAT
jgi:hypothetical protein